MGNAEEDMEKVDKEKIEYPDLYIPLMSFISYILLIAFNSAYTQGKEYKNLFIIQKRIKIIILV